MARKDYFLSAAPEPWQILGLTLRPFSIGHYIKLRRLDCGFVADESRALALSDLVLGIIVCSMRSHPDTEQDEFWVWFNRDKPGSLFANCLHGFRKRAARLLHSTHATPAERDVFNLGRKIGLFDLNKKAQCFQEYMAAHTTGLDYWLEPDTNNGKQSGAHWVHSMVTTLTGKCGYSLLDAYNISFGQCLNDYLMEAERNGAIRFMTEDEIAFAEQAGKVVAA